MEPLIGPEALAAGSLTRGELRWNYTPVNPRVWRPKSATPTLSVRTREAWMWSGRRAVIAGRAAAALHGARWISDSTPVELVTKHTRRSTGIVVREERIADDEICRVGEYLVTTPARTALDLARFLERNKAVAVLDALAAATAVTAQQALAIAGRYTRLRYLRRACIALDLMDGGAQSPRESWLRLVLVDAGFPRPRTQIGVSDGRRTAFIDMGWDEPKIGVDYEGDHHRERRPTYVDDIGRYEMIERQGWIDLRVVKEHSTAFIIHRVRQAAARRGWTP